MPKPAVQRKPLCPQCGRSEAVVAIAYRYPDSALPKAASDEVVALGGYSAQETPPRWFCQSCGNSFGEIGSAA